jgi:hypothetical protein
MKSDARGGGKRGYQLISIFSSKKTIIHKVKEEGHRCSSVVMYLPNTGKALDSSPTLQNKKENERGGAIRIIKPV